MRRLLLLVSVVVLVDTMLYAALAPLIPHLDHELGLSKGRAGLLVAAYGAGALGGAFPGGIAAAHGSRRAVLAGLAGMGLASVGFALAHSFWYLVAARLLQGLGSSFTWSGAFGWLVALTPRERRGTVIGTALGAAVFGAMLGPAVGAAAAIAGRGAVFGGLAALSLALGAWTLRIEPAPAQRPTVPALLRACRDLRFAAGLGLMALPALLFGIVSVLGPLRLAAAGWGAAAIGGVWLGSAALETVAEPLVGRAVDRHGALLPVRVSLFGSLVVSLALATDARPLAYVPLVVVAGAVYGVMFAPAFALLADGAERTGLPQGVAFGLMSAAWAAGAVVGPAAGGVIAGATGDWIPFVLAAALCGLALAATRLSGGRERAAVARL